MNKEDFINSKLEFDERGIYLKDIPIMRSWEKPFIKKQIKDILNEYNPQTVLEIGFGLGYTADEIQEFGVKKHIIVEAHPEVFEKAKEWSINKNVILINSFIQDFKTDEEIDLIYDDRYELVFNNTDFLNNIKHKIYKSFEEFHARYN